MKEDEIERPICRRTEKGRGSVFFVCKIHVNKKILMKV